MSKKTQTAPKAAIGPGRMKHGITGFLRTGKISPSIRGFRRIQRFLREIDRDITADLGGPENITAAQEVLIKATVQALGVLLLAGAYTQRYSILDPVKARRGILELQPCLGHQFIAFQNCIRQNLVALGLNRKKAEEVLDVQAYARERYGPDLLPARQGGDGQGQGKRPARARTKAGGQGQDEDAGAEAARGNTGDENNE